MSLLVALMTYTLQVIVLGLAFAVLQASGLMRSSIDGGWLGGTVIAGTAGVAGHPGHPHPEARQTYFDEPCRAAHRPGVQKRTEPGAR